MSVTVLYHSSCFDGFCAAWIFHKKNPNATFKAVNYYQQPPWEIIDGQDVFILDFSYSRELMIEIKIRAKNVLCLDHHQTAEKALQGLDFCVFDMKRSGAMLTWNYLFPEQEPPALVLYVQDRDLWQWKLPCSREVSACIGSYEFDFLTWDGFEKNYTVEELVIEGIAILRYKNQLVKRICGNAFKTRVNGIEVLTANTCVLQSEVGEELAKGMPFSATYFDKNEFERNWSLRSEENGSDVSAIAKTNGGGGHFHAAGFPEKLRRIP